MSRLTTGTPRLKGGVRTLTGGCGGSRIACCCAQGLRLQRGKRAPYVGRRGDLEGSYDDKSQQAVSAGMHGSGSGHLSRCIGGLRNRTTARAGSWARPRRSASERLTPHWTLHQHAQCTHQTLRQFPRRLPPPPAQGSPRYPCPRLGRRTIATRRHDRSGLP
jgi:hypothetical protein